ncbi:MAG: TatD family hydrolase [Saprospiraceae bacterium]
MNQSMIWVDTHTHLYSDQFDTDRAEIIAAAQNAGIAKAFLPAIDSGSHTQMLDLEEVYPHWAHAMMGLHPCSVKEDFEAELAIVRNYLDQRQFVAIGEIGIDLFWDKTFLDQQVAAFLLQIKWAKELNLPIVIHSRDATDLIIDLLERENDEKLFGIFHCFTGDLRQAQQIIGLGFHLGIGGVATFKNGGLDAVLPHIDLKHIVLETDSPYLAPVPYRGKRNETSYIPLIGQRVAELSGKSVEEIASITTENAGRVFGGC